MSKRSGTVDTDEAEDWQRAPSRQQIDAALARLQKIAEELPPVDVVAIVREARDAGRTN